MSGKKKKAIESREEEREARFRNRGINLTYRGELTKTEELVEGRRFSASPGEIAEVSVEYKYAERLGLHVGDLLKFDIQGIEMEAKIVNLRSVKWNSFQPNFFISFQPGFLEEAPKIWLVSVPPLKEEKKTDLQNSLVKQFPNVSIVDVSRVVKKIMELTDQMTVALAAMAILSVLVGLFVLLTVLLTEARSRLLEWNLLKVLGASEGSVLRIFLMESTVISLISVVLGGLLGTLVSWILVWVLFEAPFRFAWEFFLLAMGLPFVFSILLSFQLGRRLTRTSAASLLAEGRL